MKITLTFLFIFYAGFFLSAQPFEIKTLVDNQLLSNQKYIFKSQNGKIMEVLSEDSLFSINFENSYISIVGIDSIQGEKNTTHLRYGVHLFEVQFGDTLIEIDSMELYRLPGADLVPFGDHVLPGVIPFNKLNNIPVFNVFWYKFYPDSAYIEISNKKIWIGLNLWGKKYPVSYVLESSTNEYLCVFYSEKPRPKYLISYNYEKSEGIIFIFNNKSKIKRILRYESSSNLQNAQLVYYMGMNGKLKKAKKSDLKGKKLREVLSLDRRLKILSQNKSLKN